MTTVKDAQRGVVVHYHEIALKGRNRGWFERQLVRNIEAVTGAGTVDHISGRLIVRTEDEGRIDRIRDVFGVASYSPSTIVEAEIDAITSTVIDLLAGKTFRTFAVAARRATKEFPLTSQDINVAVGAAVQAVMPVDVNLSKPDVTAHIEVVGKKAYIYVDKVAGPGGLPVGVSGKVVSLLSGGIDSPVATYKLMKRGSKAILCHFHSAPFTDMSSPRKARELAAMTAARQGETTLYLIAIGNQQQQIVASCPPDLRVVLYRRLMVRIAERVAKEEGAKGLVTGDSLGQVASQTLENLACVDDAAAMPLLRPLIGDDKQEIVEVAKQIGTFETSILPFEDCCSLFVPKSPATKASIESCRRAEGELDVDAMVADAFASAEIEKISPGVGGVPR
jgi:tRNA uracil 4-sulfurtransferase